MTKRLKELVAKDLEMEWVPIGKPIIIEVDYNCSGLDIINSYAPENANAYICGESINVDTMTHFPIQFYRVDYSQ